MIFNNFISSDWEKDLNLTTKQRIAKKTKRCLSLLNFLAFVCLLTGIFAFTIWKNDPKVANLFSHYNNETKQLLNPVYSFLTLKDISPNQSGGLLLLAVGIFANLVFVPLGVFAKRVYRKDMMLTAKAAAKLQDKLNKYEYKIIKRTQEKQNKLINKANKIKYKQEYQNSKIK